MNRSLQKLPVVHSAVGGTDLQGHLGVSRGILFQDVWYAVLREVHGGGHPQCAADVVLVLLNKRAKRGQLTADLFCCLDCLLPHGCQADSGVGADKELRSQLLLDIFQSLGQGRLGKIEPRRSLCEIPGLRQSDQYVEIQLIHRAVSSLRCTCDIISPLLCSNA